ncbi:MAG: hypothetical protein U0175_16100 [Caldilineaceae bacterium]
MFLQKESSQSAHGAAIKNRLLLVLIVCIIALSLGSFHRLSAQTTSAPTQTDSTDSASQLNANIIAEEKARQELSISAQWTYVNANHQDAPTPSSFQASVDTTPILPQTPLTTTCTGLRQEAESGILTGTFVVGDDPAASGGHYIYAPTGSGNYYNGPNPQQRAEYCFSVPLTGTYNIYVTSYAEDSLSDSFYAQVDGQPSSGYLWDIYPISEYIKDYVNDRFLADPVEVQLSPGPHTVTVYIREDGTRLDTLELKLATPDSSPSPVCSGLTQEAEDGVLTGGFVVDSDPAASGGKFIQVPQGYGDYWYGPNTQQLAKYCFNVPEKGIYRLDGRVYGPDLLSDSFYVRVDKAPIQAYLWDVLRNTSYLTDSLNNRSLADPVLLKLPSGPHTVTVYLREDGTRLDKLQLVYTGTYTETEPTKTAKPISGTLVTVVDGLTDEIDFSQIYLALLDAETKGQKYQQRAQADRFGHFLFEGMEPGHYIVRIELPTLYTTTVDEVTVMATFDNPVEILFDIAVKSQKVYLPIVGK